MSAARPADLAEVLAAHRILVCAGTGGVGKTTTAAALALAGACAGRRAIVLTIDPARRLADSLGVGPLGNTPIEIDAAKLAAVGVRGPGSLAAMMLDQKGSWDELVARHAPSPEARDRILENRFYRELSQSFAGSQEYMAVEQLGALEASGRYDLIVVDTPPSHHAIDFLEAPERLLDFLDRQVIKWFVRPSVTAGWSAFQSMNRTLGFLLRQIEEATGVNALAEVADFFVGMSSLFDGFEARFQRVTGLLRDPKTAFLLVASPDEQVLDRVETLAAQMAARRMPLEGVIMNRVRPYCSLDEGRGDDAEAIAAELRQFLGKERGRSVGQEDLAARLARNFVRHQARARGDALRIEAFRDGLDFGVPLVCVPNLASDVHDLASLAALRPYLVGD